MKLSLNLDDVFFTSDTHINHLNICEATSKWPKELTRPFSSLEEMNSTIINNINKRLNKNSHLFLLGDLIFGNKNNFDWFLKSIECNNIYWCIGNHDNSLIDYISSSDVKYSKIKSIKTRINLSIRDLSIKLERGQKPPKQTFVLQHHPLASWDGIQNGTIHLHGHLHSNSQNKIFRGRMLDVGVDGNNYEIYSAREIVELFSDINPEVIIPHDSHIL